eukprot:CAMPEP_0202965292 /NCGR_PEP_ID=MMETSP1396-20130829/9317_1 /ASSEMBLY_ACC=CAM_ASM_000872 /TAXON_ID= /ORGANISM="Pseudokeronopsis sp., Strain Brazil" /LENGTH=158 /DNA_ID=CAMNT_0049687963 /DNA_START=429 /DNA_END=905 /DNA_ORIENTATION=+
MKTLLKEVMNFEEPMIVQSMYIFKNKKIGDAVCPHKDSSFLITNPLSCQGIWVAFDDASTQNGCLWGVPGSHFEDPIYYMKRKADNSGCETIFNDEKVKEYSIEGAVPLEVKAGSIVILHGNFLHYSDFNRSEEQRHAYTLHIVEAKKGVKYLEGNWL